MLHIKKIKPMFTAIVTTAERYKEDVTDGSLIVAQRGEMKPYQKIMAIGTSVRDLKEGDLVMINFNNYIVRKYDKNSLQNDLDNNPKIRYALNYVNIDDKDGNPQECLLLNDRDVLYAFEGEEKKELVKPVKQLVQIV